MGKPINEHGSEVTLRPVGRDNWRAVAHLSVTEQQREYVGVPAYYLALCCYDEIWNPLAVYLDDEVIGFLMWGVDPADQSCWLGGIFIDQRYQRRGHGRQAIQKAVDLLAQEHGCRNFALSYQPTNRIARELYRSLGFVETDEWEDDEIVARLSWS